jgi:orotidine-5'-phosphate decarboxylase
MLNGRNRRKPREEQPMQSRIILPLDHIPWEDAQKIMRMTTGRVWGYKIRRSVLERGLGVLSEIKPFGKVMLDFKIYDIPSAMTESIQMHLAAGADITTVHCSSGYDPLQHKVDGARLAGVTLLTSMDSGDFNRYYRGNTLLEVVERMAADAEPRYGYLVCSAVDLEQVGRLAIRKICPGIRPRWYLGTDDQRRTATPAEAILRGADLLVIGRPLLEADDLRDALDRTNVEIEEAR